MQAVTVGQHSSWRDRDVLHIVFEGQISDGDLRQVRGALDAILAENGRSFLIADMTRATGIDGAARRYMVEWSKQQDSSDLLSVAYGINFTTRTVLMLALNAMKLLGKQEPTPALVKDKAEALAWVAEQRALRFPELRP